MKKTTKRDFSLFCKCVQDWVDKLGLKEWRLDFVHEDCGDALSTLAYRYEDKVATVCLHTEWTEHIISVSDENIRMTAKHEAIELLTADARTMAVARYVEKGEIEAVFHSLVRRLEKVVK